MVNPIKLPNFNVEVDARNVKSWLNILSNYISVTEDMLKDLITDPIRSNVAKDIEKEIRKQGFKSLYLGVDSPSMCTQPFVMLPYMGRKFKGLIVEPGRIPSGEILKFEGFLEREVRLGFRLSYEKDSAPSREYNGTFDKEHQVYVGFLAIERDPDFSEHGSFWLKEVSRTSSNLVKDN